MAELKREIIQEDLERIKSLLNKAIGKSDYIDIERLGGMTNHSYHIVFSNGEEYLARIPGEGTEELINRQDERKSAELACELDIDTRLIYFGDDGTKVMDYVYKPKLMSEEVMKEKENIKQAADIFRKLHTCGKDTGVRFEVFEMVDAYERIIKDNNVSLYDDYEEIKKNVFDIKQEVDSGIPEIRVPCHNDSLVGNWVLSDNNRLYLIDWEYSGMNDPMWDLSCLSIEIGYNQEENDYLLESYFQRKPTNLEMKKFIASKTYVDLLWTLWGLTRVPYEGKFMEEYALGRYERLKDNIEEYHKLNS